MKKQNVVLAILGGVGAVALAAIGIKKYKDGKVDSNVEETQIENNEE